MLRIVIADDHAVVRHGIKQILHDELDVAVIAEARNADEMVETIRAGVWDLLILDVTMPGRSGLDALKEVRAYQPRLPVLILTMHPETQLAVRALRAGASGYMTKESAPEELVTAIQKILRGGKYINDTIADALVLGLRGDADEQLHKTLSDREYEVLRQIASGKTVSEIAAILSLSVKTVSTYRTRILEKMGMRTNAELTHYAVRNNLVP